MGKKGRRLTRRVNERKRMLLEVIARNPGIHLRALERQSGIALGALRNLLDSLINSDLILESQIDGRRVFFSSRGIEPDDQRIVALLRKSQLRQIVESLLHHGSRSRKELREELNIPRTTLRGHLDRMAAAGLLELGKQISLTDPIRIQRILLLTRESLIERMVNSVIEIFDENHSM